MVNSHPAEPIFCLHSGPGQPGRPLALTASEWFTISDTLLELNLTGSLLTRWISRGPANNQLRPGVVALLVIVICSARHSALRVVVHVVALHIVSPLGAPRRMNNCG